jgi:hypothetical protein
MSDDQNFRNAYLVLAHEDVDMLNLLAKRLINTGYVYIHLDLKCSIKIEQVISHPKVKVSKKIKVNWGGFSIVEATRFLADQALADESARLTLLSGLPFLIASDEKLLSFAQSSRELIGTWIVDFNMASNTFKKRFTTRHFSFPLGQGILGRVIRKTSRIICSLLPRLSPIQELSSVVLTSGSQWWSVKSETYKSAMQLSEGQPAIQEYFKKIECSDESFFGTLFHHVAPGLIGHGTTYVKWTGSGGPKVPTKEDIEFEQKEETFLFARKIFSSNQEIITHLS